MRFYQEIRFFPTQDVAVNFLWSKIYQQLHLALVAIQDENGRVPVGVGFPDFVAQEARRELGTRLRIHGPDRASIENLGLSSWLSRLIDYIELSEIRDVPDYPTGFAVFQRKQLKGGVERLARRYASRHGITYEEALLAYQGFREQTISEPYLRLKSQSTGHHYCLWIKKTVLNKSNPGTFNTFGLSDFATVPEF